MNEQIKEAFRKGFKKEAQSYWANPDTVEDRAGVPLNKEEEQKARQLLQSQVDKSTVLQHPYLTGIPTLGIAPAIAGSQASDKAFRKMRRENPELVERIQQQKEKEHQRKKDLMQERIERRKARSNERMAREMGDTAKDVAGKVTGENSE